MRWLWTWGGTCFGYREGNELWTHDGRHVGRFYGGEVFAPNGRYLGEMDGSSSNRLVTNLAKKSLWRDSFVPNSSRAGHVPYAKYVRNVMHAGYEDFASPEEVR